MSKSDVPFRICGCAKLAITITGMLPLIRRDATILAPKLGYKTRFIDFYEKSQLLFVRSTVSNVRVTDILWYNSIVLEPE